MLLTRLLVPFAVFAALALPAPAPAGEDGLSGIARIEVLDGGATARGTQLAAIRVTLREGWKTYWRSPGDAGIPPHFDWRGSRNVKGVEITWPAPIVFDQGGLRSVGYAGGMVLPLEIAPERPGRPVRLTGEVELGVCKDVCVPERLRFDHRLDPAAGRNPAIVAALAARPWSAEEAGVERVTCRIRPMSGGLRVEARIAMPPAGAPEFAVIEAGAPGVWVSEAEVRREGGMLVAVAEMAHASGGVFALDRSRLRLTVLGRSHAVDILGCAPE